MKKVLFKTLSIQNFLSVGETAINLEFSKGINLITGENLDNNTRNGVGKSSVIEAIYWCLFGSTIRDIKNDKIVHNLSKKSCEVSLTFDLILANNQKSLFEIKRFLNPSKIHIFKDEENITLSTIPANDDYIKNLIGGTEELFNNSVILTANNTMPFMAQKKIDKRKFLESVFNLNIFSDLLLKSRSDFNESKKENDILSNSFLNEQKNLEIFENQFIKQKKIKEEKIQKINSLILEVENEIKTIKNTSLNIKEIDEKLKKLNEKLLEITSLLEEKENKILTFNNIKSELKIKIELLQKEKQTITKKKETCPVCNRKYSEENISHVEQTLQKIEDEIQKLTKQNTENAEKLQKELTNKQKIKSTIDIINQQKTDILKNKQAEELKDEKIKNLNKKNEEYIKNIKDLNDEKNTFQEEIDKTNKNINELDKKLKKIKEELAVLEYVKFVLSEEGVKTFIVKKMLDVLNEKLNFYLKQLNAPCTCMFNEQFEEVIKNTNGKECSYFNFSGGERKRIDVAILFMFQDILRYYSGTNFSLSMYDELFDSALDDSGVEKILEVLKKRVEDYNESIYIVSHNKSAIKNTFDSVIFLKKENGQTLIAS
jgi:DNA repair exonuclease SbcCD ATPase subunit